MNRFIRRGFLGALAGSAAGTPLLFLSTDRRSRVCRGHRRGLDVCSLRSSGSRRLRGQHYGRGLPGNSNLGNHQRYLASRAFRQPHGLDAVGMQGHFAPLVGWILFGALLGGILQIVSEIAEIRYGPESAPASPPTTNLTRIVILGGGFGGMKAAEYLEEELGSSVSISLVSDTNALLFTPMLAEVAGSSLEPSHISVPLRSSLRQTHFVRGRVTGRRF